MNNNDELIKQFKSKYPGLGSYMECVSRAYLTGLAGLSLSFGGTYFAQHLLRNIFPYSLKLSILISTAVSIPFSYYLTSVQTQFCQNAWMAQEDKHTFLNPISERKDKENLALDDSQP